MAVYMFSYDLYGRTPEQYEKDSDSIKRTVGSFGPFCKHLTTTYLFNSSNAFNEISRKLNQHMEPHDRMLLCQIKKPIIGQLSNEQWEEVHANL